MPEIITFGKIGAEDLNTGTGTFEATLPDGTVVTLTRINSTAFVPVYTDSTRPSAVGLPVGYMIWNTDDNAPNFSDGTNWRNAAGSTT